MQFKPITAIAVLLLVVASLLVAGCTTSNTSNAPTGHDALLEKYIAFEKQTLSPAGVTAWDVTWNNATSATILFSTKAIEGKKTYTTSGNVTAMVLPSTSAASNYLSALDKTKYTLVSSDSKNETLTSWYYNATGHYPSVYNGYIYTEGLGLLLGSVTIHSVLQYDNLIIVTSGSLKTS